MGAVFGALAAVSAAPAFVDNVDRICSAGDGALPPRYATIKYEVRATRADTRAVAASAVDAWYKGMTGEQYRQSGRPFGAGPIGEVPKSAAERTRRSDARLASLEHTLTASATQREILGAVATLLVEFRCERAVEAGTGRPLLCPMTARVLDAYADLRQGEGKESTERQAWGAPLAVARLCEPAADFAWHVVAPGEDTAPANASNAWGGQELDHGGTPWRVVGAGGEVWTQGSAMGSLLPLGAAPAHAAAASYLEVVRASIAGKASHERSQAPSSRCWAESWTLADWEGPSPAPSAAAALLSGATATTSQDRGAGPLTDAAGNGTAGARPAEDAAAVVGALGLSYDARHIVSAYSMASGVLRAAHEEAATVRAAGFGWVPPGLEDVDGVGFLALPALTNSSGAAAGGALEWVLARRARVHAMTWLRRLDPAPPGAGSSGAGRRRAAPGHAGSSGARRLRVYPLTPGILLAHRVVAVDWLRALRTAGLKEAQIALGHTIVRADREQGPGVGGARGPAREAEIAQAAARAAAREAARFGPVKTSPHVVLVDAEAEIGCVCGEEGGPTGLTPGPFAALSGVGTGDGTGGGNGDGDGDGGDQVPGAAAAARLAAGVEAPSARPASAEEAAERTRARAERAWRQKEGRVVDPGQALSAAALDARTVEGGAIAWQNCSAVCAILGGERES